MDENENLGSNVEQPNESQDVVELKPSNSEDSEFSSADGSVASETPNPTAEEEIPNPVAEPTTADGNKGGMSPVSAQPDFGNASTGEVKKKSAGPIIAIVAVIAVIAAVVVFVLPGLKKQFMSKPKNVFDSVINNASKQLNNTIKTAGLGSSIYSGTVKIETNVDALKDFDGSTFGFRAGVDGKNKLAEGKISYSAKGSKEISAEGYVKADTVFYKLSSDTRLFKAGTLDELGMGDLFDYVENSNAEDTVYLSEKITKLLLECFSDDEFAKEDATITVNGKEVKVTKNTYELTKARIEKIFKHVTEGLYNDSKAMEIITKEADISKEDFKKEMDEADFSDIADDFKVVFNLYTNSKAEVIGGDVEGLTDQKSYYYTNEGDFDMYISVGSDSITATGRKNGEKTNVSIKVGSEEIAKLVVSKWDDNNIVFDYEVNVEDEKVTGSIDFKRTQSGSTENIDFSGSVTTNGQTVKLIMNFKIEGNAKFTSINEGSAVKLTGSDEEKVLEKFAEELQDTPLYSAIASSAQSAYSYDDYDDDWSYDLSEDDDDDDWGFDGNFPEESDDDDWSITG